MNVSLKLLMTGFDSTWCQMSPIFQAVQKDFQDQCPPVPISRYLSIIFSVTRSGDLLDFGKLLKSLATINLPKSPKFLGNFRKGVKIYHFSSEIMFRQLLQTFGNFFLVTLTLVLLFQFREKGQIVQISFKNSFITLASGSDV